MKKIFLILLIVLFIVVIYNFTKDDKIYYLNIGDGVAIGKSENNETYGYDKYIIDYLEKSNSFEKYSNSYTNVNYRSTDIIALIKNNAANNKISILNDLIKADITTISIGINDLLPYLNDNTLLLEEKTYEIVKDFENLFYMLRSNSKEKIFLIGIYNPNLSFEYNELLKKINNLLRIKVKEYDIQYIDIFEEMEKLENLGSDSIYPTQAGYKMIASKVIEFLD
jgi:lysophospholipase L1-like esterase